MREPALLRHAIPCPDLERHRALELELQDGRDAHPRHQRDFAVTCRRATLGEVLDRIARTERSNDFYVCARNRLLAQPGAEALLAELAPLPAFVRSPPRPDEVLMWIGPAGTRSALHYDREDAAIAQLRGRKRIYLLPPSDPRVQNREGRFGDADVTTLGAIEVVLSPGELVIVPAGWWHEVIALDASVTLSLTGFVD